MGGEGNRLATHTNTKPKRIKETVSASVLYNIGIDFHRWHRNGYLPLDGDVVCFNNFPVGQLLSALVIH